MLCKIRKFETKRRSSQLSPTTQAFFSAIKGIKPKKKFPINVRSFRFRQKKERKEKFN